MSIAQRPMNAVRLLAFALIINTAVELFYTWRLLQTDYEAGLLSYLFVMFINFAVVGIVAVSWHRSFLRDEPLGWFPTHEPALYGRYVKYWFVLGLIIILPVILGFAVIATLAWLLAEDLFATTNLFFESFYGETLFALLCGVLVVGCTYLLFRWGMVLPQVALERPELGTSRAWALTKPQAMPIFWAAVIAGSLQALSYVVLYAISYGLADPETGYLSAQAEYGLAVAVAINYSVSVLIGAAILTTIYARIDPTVLAQGLDAQP